MYTGIVEPKSITFATDLRLESGRILGPITLAYETYGELNAERSNAVLVAHAWTGSAHLAGKYGEEEQKPGWWDAIVGPGRLLDTDIYCVICVNVIGSCFGSTGPASINPKTGRKYNLSFPVITVRDMVRAQTLLIDHLGIDKLVTVLGGSMGGMQALEWATQFPDRIASAIVLAATARPSAQAIALNAVAPDALVRAFENAMKNWPMAERRKMFGYPTAFINAQMFAGLFRDRMFLRLSETDRIKFMAEHATGPFEPVPGRRLLPTRTAAFIVVAMPTSWRFS